jgi:hypothetical protein
MTSFRKYQGLSADFITNYGANVTAPVQTWDLYATMIDAAAGTATVSGTDSISLWPCFAGTISTCAGTRFHYAETFDYDSLGDLDYGEAAVGFVVSSSEYSMRAVYDETNECMTSELYKLTGTGADPHEYTDLFGSAAYVSTCNTLRDKFATVDAAWMPHTGDDIYWCTCSCTGGPCP